MKIFLTGATGYIGSVIAEKLLEKGHEVTGLARSEQSVAALLSKSVAVVHGDLGDLELLTRTAAEFDGVIHAGFRQSDNGFSAAMAEERKVVNALLAGLGNSGKPFIYTGGTGMLGDTGTIVFDEQTPDRFQKGKAAIDDNEEMEQAGRERMMTEKNVLQAKGVRGIVLRPPNVYGRSNGYGLLAYLATTLKKTGALPYADFSGEHLWTFVHVDDLAELYVLALEKSPAGELYYTGAQSGITTKAIAKALSRAISSEGKIRATSMSELVDILGHPILSEFWTWNNQSSAEKAKRVLGWKPNHEDMLNEMVKLLD